MKRNKHHKVKKELPESSTSHNRAQEEHDLAYYIHDRVELMHQVFSVLKHKELRAMAPACIRNISVDDLQELCTEELLGISSKRLCAILDGAGPPSDTESSSQSATEQLETISLDSISSDEEILSQEDRSKKKKHKHRRRDSKTKRKQSRDDDEQQTEKSKASRAGLTVLELLELQARARAIRAQLQQEQIKPVSDTVAPVSTQSTQSSEDEVEIKEEPAEVVEISSDEEKPKIEELEINKSPQKPESQTKTITKHVNDLVITVPQQKTQKIKLNRTKSAPHDNNTKTLATTVENKDKTSKEKEVNVSKRASKDSTSKPKDKTKKKKKKRLSNASDNDEITLQLSDTEKMDLLEDLDRKNYDNVSSDTSSDSDSDVDNKKDKQADKEARKAIRREKKSSDTDFDAGKKCHDGIVKESTVRNRKSSKESKISDEKEIAEVPMQDTVVKSLNTEQDNVLKETDVEQSKNNEEISFISDSDLNQIEKLNENDNIDKELTETEELNKDTLREDDKIELNVAVLKDSCDKPEVISKELSEGELSDRESSEVEAVDLKPEVVCISDEEDSKTRKKKKKKEKKSKKDKKNKKKDFRESADENFHKITENIINISGASIKDLANIAEVIDDSSQSQLQKNAIGEKEIIVSSTEIDLTTPDKSQDSVITIENPSPIDLHKTSEDNELKDEDDSKSEIVEISDEVYELSDDSSNDENAEISNVLSKEPTALEIEALSAKIDEIERVEVITDEEIREYESKKEEDVALSWKDRYLDSKKVKRVLNTSNILNALRKKNRQLKKRLELSKVETQDNVEVETEVAEVKIAEGSIDQYNTLQGSTKYVDLEKHIIPINDTLKKDAKQLLKMYKKLLKYNDMNRKRDPSKKRKKKKSKMTEEKVDAKIDA